MNLWVVMHIRGAQKEKNRIRQSRSGLLAYGLACPWPTCLSGRRAILCQCMASQIERPGNEHAGRCIQLEQVKSLEGFIERANGRGGNSCGKRHAGEFDRIKRGIGRGIGTVTISFASPLKAAK